MQPPGMSVELLQDLLLRDRAARHPDREFLVMGKRSLTYGQVAAMSGKVAKALLDMGVERGDRVLVLLDNSPEYVAVFFGTLAAGAVCVPANPRTTAEEIRVLVDDCGPAVVAAQAKAAGHLSEALNLTGRIDTPVLTLGRAPGNAFPKNRRIEDVLADDDTAIARPQAGPGDPCCIMYTSGTTGAPKGVVLSHRNLLANAASITASLDLVEGDRVMCVLPFFFSYGTSLLTTHLVIGGSLVIRNGFAFPNSVLDEMVKTRCTGFAGVPSMYALLMHRSRFSMMSFPDLRYVTIAGGGLPAPAQARLRQVLAGVRIYNMYGQTEGTARLSCLPHEDFQAKLGSIGKGLPGVELRVVEKDGTPVRPGATGEIIARGDNVMLGYWNSPEETARVLRDGWLWTGDLATVDEDGYIFIVGREKDFIKTGGFRIGPASIESVLMEVPEVAEAAVIGAPHELLGEAIVAYIVPVPGADILPRDLVAHCRERLPYHKVPHRFRVVADLPRTPSGKVRKHLLREREAREEHC